ncbi:MAG: hypothetical protein IKL49_01655 [Lachnospiraceae bacterium]|nr:hypothetical protein [Lachnospiraceae bacterium]
MFFHCSSLPTLNIVRFLIVRFLTFFF